MNVLENHWQRLPEKVLRRAQGQRLQRYLEEVVAPFSPHYRHLFRELGLRPQAIRSIEDLRHLPFTTKADLLNTPAQPQRFREFVLAPDPKILSRRPSVALQAMLHGREQVKKELESEFRPVFITFTTGRSAEPSPVLYTQRDLAHLATAGRRVVEVCGARREDRLFNTFPFAPHLAFWLAHYAGTASGTMLLSSGGGKVMGTEGNLRNLGKFKPDVLIGIPTFIYHLLHQAAEQGLRCENLRRIVLGGEKVSNGLRQKLRDLARELGASVDVLATYGFTEAKLAWPECPFPQDQSASGYHLYPDLGILEIIDPETGQSLPAGQPGEIVYTPLDARGTVLLRYRTGDFTDGGLTYEPCPHCGRTLPRVLGNISRQSEVKEMHLDKIKGTLVDFNELAHLLDEAPQVGAWQVELRKVNDDPHELDELILHVETINGADRAKLSRELSQRCHERIDLHPNRIFFHSADEMRELQGVGRVLKEERLVDRRPRANGTPSPVTISADLKEVAASPNTPTMK